MRSSPLKPYIALALTLIGLISCGCGDQRPDRDAMSPAEYFQATQANTMTPHGRIKAESVQDVGDKRIRYETESGRKFELTATPEGNGYRYSDAKAVD